MKVTKKTKGTDATLSIATNTTINTSTQTPIEIALQIDENGMTSLRNLYEFLELDQSHYKRWYNKNIVNNDFAVENVDYTIIRLEGENSKGGRPTLEFKLTSDFAKQLCMTVKNERGKQARDYFIACEQGLKIATQKIQSTQTDLTPLVDMLSAMTQSITTLINNMITMQQDIQELKQAQRNRYLLENRYPSA